MTDEHPVGPARGERVLARIPIPVYCSVTLAADGRNHPYTAAASHEIVDRFDQEQYAVGEGPCLRTLRTGEPNHVVDVDQERRFGAFPVVANVGGRPPTVRPPAPRRPWPAGRRPASAARPGRP